MAKHIARKVMRGVIYKRCACCGGYKPESEFNLRNDTADKIQYRKEQTISYRGRIRGTQGSFLFYCSLKYPLCKNSRAELSPI